MRKQGSGNMTRSEESITSMTFYRFPHHGDRFFASALNDALPASSLQQQILHIRSGWRLTLASLLSNNKKTVRLSLAYIKIRYPSHLTSTVFYFLYYFLILVFVFQFTLPGKYENRTHHGNHCLPYRLRCWRGHVLPYFCHCPCRKYGRHGYDPDESGGVPVRTHS